MQAFTEKQKTLIINNILKATKDITKLNKTGYSFIYLASGFIAHYNLGGFIDYYTDYSLIDDIKRNIDNNQWHNFHEGENNYEYQMSKKDIYNRIANAI
jgi:hypothetical protein